VGVQQVNILFTDDYRLLALFLMVLGASGVVACLTRGLLLRETSANLTSMVEEKLTEAQKIQINFLKRSFSVTAQSLEYHLQDILAPRYRLVVGEDGRRSVEPNLRTFEKLADHLKHYIKEFINNPPDKDQRERFILVNGITLKDLVDPGNPLSNCISNMVKELSYETRKQAMGKRRVVIRALMLNPTCASLNLRRNIMHPTPSANPSAANKKVEDFFQQLPSQARAKISEAEDRLRGDIEYSIRAFRNLTHIIETKHSALTVELKHTIVLPPAYFIMTEEYVFMELYHLGRENFNGSSRCLVGLVPILQFSCASPMYKYLRKHFEFLWQIEQDRELNKIYRVETLI